MKFINISVIWILFVGNICGQVQNTDSSTSLENIVVNEVYEVELSEEKLPIYLKEDFSGIIKMPEILHWSSVKTENLFDNNYSDFININFSSPELINIIPEPAKIFRINFKDLSSWKLTIFADDGSDFWSTSGKENPPPSITWEGRGNSGVPLVPGATYSYSFTAVDHAGNRRIFPGESFSVPALYLVDNNQLWVGIAPHCIFSSDGFSLTPVAINYCKELVNLIYYYFQGGTVSVKCAHPLINEFLTELSTSLGKNLDFFKTETETSASNKSFTMLIE
jgi:hypothetical protein